MAKIGNIVTRKPIETSVEGIFILDLPAKVVDAKFGDIGDDMKANPEKVITLLFTGLICDANGDHFEDCSTFDLITENLSVRAINEIVNAIPEALMPSASSAKK